MPQMKTLVELFRCLKQVAILRIPFEISSDEDWCRLLYNIITLLKDEKVRKLCAPHSTSCTLSPPIPLLRDRV